MAPAAKCPQPILYNHSVPSSLDFPLLGFSDFVGILLGKRTLRPFVIIGEAHLRGIITVCFKIFTERSILLHQAIVRKRADEEKGNEGAEDCETTADPEWPSVATVRVWATKVCGLYK